MCCYARHCKRETTLVFRPCALFGWVGGGGVADRKAVGLYGTGPPADSFCRDGKVRVSLCLLPPPPSDVRHMLHHRPWNFVPLPLYPIQFSCIAPWFTARTPTKPNLKRDGLYHRDTKMRVVRFISGNERCVICVRFFAHHLPGLMLTPVAIVKDHV